MVYVDSHSGAFLTWHSGSKILQRRSPSSLDLTVNSLSWRNFNLPILWHIPLSDLLLSVHLMTMLSPSQSSPEGLQTSLWRSWKSPFCLFETTIMKSIFPSKRSFQSPSALPLLSRPDVASVGNYHYVFIQGQPTEEAVVLEASAWVWWLCGRVAGKRDGWLLRRSIHVSDRSHTWADTYCGSDLPVAMLLTQSSFVGGSAPLLSLFQILPISASLWGVKAVQHFINCLINFNTAGSKSDWQINLSIISSTETMEMPLHDL